MSSKGDNDGCVGVAGLVLVVMIISGIMAIPKVVWTGLGVVLGVVVGVGAAALVGKLIYDEVVRRLKLRAVVDEQQRKAQATADKRHREKSLGTSNAHRVETALASVSQIAQSRAAQEGWLGDIDFTTDIQGIEEGFTRAQELRTVADELRALSEPTLDDRALLTDAVEAAQKLVETGQARVDLIIECAKEALLVDQSLSQEDERARTEEQREQLHRKLNSMLYGADASTVDTDNSTVADQILARVAGYREIKQQVTRAGSDDLPSD